MSICATCGKPGLHGHWIDAAMRAVEPPLPANAFKDPDPLECDICDAPEARWTVRLEGEKLQLCRDCADAVDPPTPTPKNDKDFGSLKSFDRMHLRTMIVLSTLAAALGILAVVIL